MHSDLRRMLAEGLATAEREYRDAQTALQRDGSDAARARYAQAERNYKKMEQLLKAAEGGRPRVSPPGERGGEALLRRRAERPRQDGPAKQLQDYAFTPAKNLKS